MTTVYLCVITVYVKYIQCDDEVHHGYHHQQLRRRAHLRPDHPADEGPHPPGREELRISVITTKRAYEELERDGFITTVPGKGCFVAPRNLELVHEETLRRAEEHLSQAVDIAKTGGITLAELTETLSLLYGEETV